MHWIGRVVNLMVRRADENASERSAERNPYVRVLAVDVNVDAHDEQAETFRRARVMFGSGWAWQTLNGFVIRPFTLSLCCSPVAQW